jgi:AcrR family transcriptional regulator
VTERRTTVRRREEIVDAALELLATTSVEALSTHRIAGALGLTQPALFRHFASRDELLAAVVARAREGLAAMAAETVARELPALDRLRALFRGLLEQVERTPGLPRLVFADAAAASPALGPRLGGLAAMHRSIAAALFREGRRAGSIAAGVDAELAGAAFAALVQGAVLGWQLEGRPAGLAGRAAPMLELLLSGARAGGVPRAPAPAAARARRRRAVVDAGALLAAGGDPLASTLAAVARVGAGGLVVLHAPFRPAPLARVLEAGGHAVREHDGPGGGCTLEITVGGAAARTSGGAR